jgi:hypothetical protein
VGWSEKAKDERHSFRASALTSTRSEIQTRSPFGPTPRRLRSHDVGPKAYLNGSTITHGHGRGPYVSWPLH